MAYSPAGNSTTSTGIANAVATFYKRKGLDRLQKKFTFREACMKDILPRQSGRTVQFFRYNNLPVNTTTTTEGTVGSSLSTSNRVIGATVSQYSNFITVSDLLADTAIDPVIQNNAELLGYQAGLSVDTMTRNVIDSQSTSGSGTAPDQLPLQTFAKAADWNSSRSNLQANDVEPMDDGDFFSISHPFVTYDLVNDPQAVGLADTFKYTAPMNTPLVKYEDRGQVTRIRGCRIIESTNVFTLTGPNRYRTYVFGKGGVGSVDLEGRGPSDVKDPTKQRFNINIIPGAPSIPDPEGLIGGAVSYNFIFTTLILDGPAGIGGQFRYRTIDFQSSIG